jgi:hypothetical protein
LPAGYTVRRIGRLPSESEQCGTPDYCPYRRADDQGCHAEARPWRQPNPASWGQVIPGARLPPGDQPACARRPNEGNFFNRRAREIANVAAATQMPEHGIDIGPLVLPVHRRNSHSRYAMISRRIGLERYYP